MAALLLPLRHAAVDVDCAADLEEDRAFLLLLVVAVDVQTSTRRAVALGFGRIALQHLLLYGTPAG